MRRAIRRSVELSTKLTRGSAAVVSAPGCIARFRLVCRLGSLALGKTKTIRIVLRSRRAGRYRNEARVAAVDGSDPTPANNTVTVITTVRR
jgi:Domain of unknown function DUF11